MHCGSRLNSHCTEHILLQITMLIIVLIHIFFYTVTCPPLRLREEDEKRNVTYNTSLLTDELHSRKGYSVNTIASFQCVLVIFTAQSHKDYESSAEWSSVTCKSSGKWSEWTSTCDSGNENEKLFSTDVFYFAKLFF